MAAFTFMQQISGCEPHSGLVNMAEICSEGHQKGTIKFNSKKADMTVQINKIDNQNVNEWTNWIEEAITKEYLKYYDYDHFSNFQEIGSGSFGEVLRANWRNLKHFALKSFRFDNTTVKEIVHELKLHRNVDYSNNIIRFHGITTNYQVNHNGQVKKYLLVLEYADGGSLRSYLKRNFISLTWSDKYNLAKQLANAELCIHSGNVLVHQNTIKLADFGLSKRLDEGSKLLSKAFGSVPYMDPSRRTYDNNNNISGTLYDVFSLGVLFWEISSGHPPFENTNYDSHLAVDIAGGYREAIVPDTPIDYSNLYTECWDNEPSNRPTTSQVVKRLDEIINPTPIDNSNNDIVVEQLSHVQQSILVVSSSLRFSLSQFQENFNAKTEELTKSNVIEDNIQNNRQSITNIISEGCQNADVHVDDIKIQMNDLLRLSNRLNLQDKLTNIWERFKQNGIIEMSDTLSFVEKHCCYESSLVLKDKLTNIWEKLNQNNMIETSVALSEGRQNETIDDIQVITVQIDDSETPVIVSLNLNDNLSNTRKLLQTKVTVEVNALLFAKKSSTGIVEITRENEGNRILKDFIEEVGEIKNLYMRKEKPDWATFNHKFKLDFGRTITHDEFKEANKRAFIMTGCEMTDISGFQRYNTEINSDEERIMKNNLLLTAEAESGPNSICNVSEYSKVSLNFIEYLKPTEEFIKVIEDAIESKNPRDFMKITEEFGQFIPTEVILGGKAYFERSNTFEENIQDLNIEKENTFESLNRKLVGGKRFSLKDFDEPAWFESLKDFRNWSCIKFKDPISIFQLLPSYLRKQVLSLVGKSILHTSTEDLVYHLSEHGKPKVFDLNIPENILGILRNKETECSIFATVIDTEEAKNDFFNCQILWLPDQDPSLIIHCIQKKFRERKCELKIRWMIIGYDVEFNFNYSNYFNVQLKVQSDHFNTSNSQSVAKSLDSKYDSSDLCFGIPVLRKLDSSNNSLVIGHHFFNDQESRKIGSYIFSYCLKNNHYVNLPDFSFYTLIISNDPKSDNCGLLPFRSNSMISNSFYFIKTNPKPKYISLFSTGENICGPIFIKQKINENKKKYVDEICDQNECICKNKTLKKFEYNLKYAFFDPI